MVMRKQDAVEALRGQADEVKARGVTALYLFGSMARDESLAASDLDLFVDYDQGGRFSLVDLVGVKQLLERRLGVPVDLTTRDSLDPLLRSGIEASAERDFDGATSPSGVAGHDAARRIPPEVLASQPQIPWSQIAEIGNVLRHEYHRVADRLIWKVVQVNFPPLKAAVLAIEAS